MTSSPASRVEASLSCMGTRRPRALIALIALCVSCDMSRPKRALTPGTCPQLAAPGQTVPMNLDSSCNTDRCGLLVTQQGCQLKLQPTNCVLVNGDDSFSATLESDGSLAFDQPTNYGLCESITAWPEAMASFICERPFKDCRFDLYTPREANDAELSVQQLSLVSPPCLPGNTGWPGAVNSFGPLEGCVAGLAKIEDRLAVARYSSSRSLRCLNTAAELLLIDPERMRIEQTMPAPPCLAFLTTFNGALLGLTNDGTHSLAEFSAQGELLSQVALPLSDPGAVTPLALQIDHAKQELIAVYSDIDRDTPGILVVLDRNLNVLRVLQTPPAQIQGVQVVGAGRLAVGSREDDGFLVISTDESAPTIELRVHTRRFLSNNISYMSFHEPTRRLLFSATGNSPAIWSAEGPPQFSREDYHAAAFYQERGFPWSMITAPWSPELLVVGVSTGVETPAQAALFNVEQNRYLPGTAELANGVVERMVSDQSAVYGLQTWSGTLVKIQKRSPAP